jgi:hypothetical protein
MSYVKSKSLGREKAKENAFIKLMTVPGDYTPEDYGTLRIWDRVKNCQLCGQHIEYDFLLKHKANPDKNLYVGSDCIISFCETHLPNLVGMLLAKMELKMQELVEQRKAAVFAEKNPNFSEDCSKLRKGMQEKILALGLYSDFQYGKLRLPIFETLAEADSDFRSKKYTTGPKVEEIIYQLKELSTGKFEEDLKEFAENKKSTKTIAEDFKDNEDFYNSYFKYAKYMKWDKESPTMQSKALSRLEKDIFILRAEDYEAKRERNKKKLNKNKKDIFERIRREISDSRLIVQKIESSSHRFSYISDPKLKTEIANYESYFDRGKLVYIPSKLDDELTTFGLSSLKDFFRKPVEHYAEIGKAEDHYIYTNEYILFKDQSSALRFIDNLKTIVENKLQEIENYLASDDIVTSEIN